MRTCGTKRLMLTTTITSFSLHSASSRSTLPSLEMTASPGVPDIYHRLVFFFFGPSFPTASHQGSESHARPAFVTTMGFFQNAGSVCDLGCMVGQEQHRHRVRDWTTLQNATRDNWVKTDSFLHHAFLHHACSLFHLATQNNATFIANTTTPNKLLARTS